MVSYSEVGKVIEASWELDDRGRDGELMKGGGLQLI